MKRRRMYSQKIYGNPYFRKRRKIRRLSLKVKLIIAGIIIILGGIFWLLLFHSFFIIDNIIIRGSSRVEAEGERIEESKIKSLIKQQLLEKRLLFFNQNNIFAFNKKRAKKEILKKYYVSNLKINKKLPRTIEINFTEKIAAAVWSENDKYYYIDDAGDILYEIEALEINTEDFIILKNKNEQSKIKTSGLTKKLTVGEGYIDFCLMLARKVKDSDILLTYNIFIINEDESTAEIHLVQGPIIYFNIEENLDKQFKKLEILLTEKVKGEMLKKIEYIDLRFGDKIYYK